MPKTEDTQRVQTTMRLRGDMLAPLDHEAGRRGLSRTGLVEQVLAKFLKDLGHDVSLKVTL